MAAPTMLEQSRTHTVIGAFGASGTTGGLCVGGAITALTNATPSVFTTTTPHGLIVGDFVQVQGITTDTAVNGNVAVSAVGSSTTFSIATAGNGVAAGLSAASASQALPISGVTGDWTLRLRLESLTAAKNIEIAFEDSVDGITWITRVTRNIKGAVLTGAMIDLISIRKYDFPMFRFGTANAVLRMNILAIDSAATAVISAWYEN
jgi:hypothetical protein